MAPFDESYTTFYWSAIVNIALSDTFFELFDVKWYHNLEIWVRGHWRSFKLVPFESLGAVFYSPSVVTMAIFLFCIICEVIGRKSCFFHNPLHSTLPLRSPRQNIAISFALEKLEWWVCMYNRLDTIPACDGQTDGQTDGPTDRHFATA